MSAYKHIKTEFRSLPLLLQALQEAGVPFEQGVDLPLYGYQGDRRAETADLVVRRAHIGCAANDLGFRRAAGGRYEAVISEWDSEADEEGRALRVLSRVRQRYARAGVIARARAQGYRVVEEQAPGGVIRLKLRK